MKNLIFRNCLRQQVKWIMFLFAAFLASCNIFKDVEVKGVTEVRFLGIKDKGIEMEVYMEIDNPNAYKLRLTYSDVDLFLEGKSVGKVRLLEPVIVPKKSISVQMIKTNTSFSSLGSLLGNNLGILLKKEFEIEGKGVVTGKILFLSKKVPIGFKEKVDRKSLGI